MIGQTQTHERPYLQRSELAAVEGADPDIVPNKVHSHVYVLGAGAGLGLTVGQCPVSFKIFLHILFSREFNEPLLYRTIFPQRKKPGNFGSCSFFVLFT